MAAPIFFQTYSDAQIDSFTSENNRNPINHSELLPLWTPQERFASPLVWSALLQLLGISEQPAVAAPRSDPSRPTLTTINRRPVFNFVEMVYPGNIFSPISDKWIYGFHVPSSRCVVEIYAANQPGVLLPQWRYRLNPTPDTQNDAPLPDLPTRPVMMELTSLQDIASNYRFMLSPFRLSASGLRSIMGASPRPSPLQPQSDSILNNTGSVASSISGLDVSSLVQPRLIRDNGQDVAIAALPDPFRWAVDAHEQYYDPAVTDWQNWVNNFDRQAQRTIARALSNWIETNHDAYDVRDDLQANEPESHLRQYERAEFRQRFHMELAALYLKRWTNQADFRAVELSAQERRGQSISVTLQMYAVVVQNLLVSANGRRMLQELTDAANGRAPQQYAFPTDAAMTWQSQFGNSRYAWAATVAIFEAAKSAWLNNFILRATETQRGNVSRYTLAWAYVRRLYEGLATDEQLRNAFPSRLTRSGNTNSAAHLWRDMSNPESRRFLRETAGLAEQQLGDAAGRITASVDHIHLEYQNPFTRIRFSVAGLFEGMNFALAIANLSDNLSSDDRRWGSIISFCGASADLSALMLSYMERRSGAAALSRYINAGSAAPAVLQGTQTVEDVVAGAVRNVRIAGGVAGIVAGLCQFYDEVNQASSASSQMQDWQVIGHSAAAVGATMTALGAALTVSEVLGWVASSSVGGWITFIGAALILAGNIVAALVTFNPFELFARFCFLGAGYHPPTGNVGAVYVLPGVRYYNGGNVTNLPPWAQGELNTRSLQSQLRVLHGLVQGFSLETFAAGRNIPNGRSFNCPHLRVRFGVLPPEAVLHIELVQRYGDRQRPEQFTARYVVRFDRITNDMRDFDWSQGGQAQDSLISGRDAFQISRNSSNFIEWLSFDPLPGLLGVQNGTFNPYDRLNYHGPFECWVRVRMEAGNVRNPAIPGTFLQVNIMDPAITIVNCFQTEYWSPQPAS